MKKALFALLVVCLLPAFVSADEAKLLRYPDIYKDKIVFVYGGDLWLVSSEGGVATRLTTHEGMEMMPKFSPDGKYIAFTGEYDGNNDVFIIPATGGVPKRLTFHPDADMVLGWFPDSKSVLFRSARTSPVPKYDKLFKAPIDGSVPEELPLYKAELSSLNADGSKVAFNDWAREFRTWKRYRGGRAPEIWIYDFNANTSENITKNEANDMFPMWHGDTIYFSSDRAVSKDGRFKYQIFAHDLKTGEVKQCTDMPEYDVLWPSLGPDAIVFENGGEIYKYDLASGATSKVAVEIFDDFRNLRPEIKNVENYIHSADISPTGARALFEARGDIFTVPAEKGEIRNITQTPGIRERFPVWSPNGKWIAYVSDKTGEFQIYVRLADGTGEEKQVTEDLKTYFNALSWSPDNKKIGYSDVTNTYYYVEIGSKKITKVFHDDNAGTGNFVNASWAPDSNWLTYQKNDPSGFNSIYIYSLPEDKEYRVTSGLTSDTSPAFSQDGKYLVWSADREQNFAFSSFEFNYYFENPSKIVLACLQADGANPLGPESDEEKVVEDKKPEEKKPENGEKKADDKGKDDKKAEEKDDSIKIDFEGLEDRLVALPIPDSNYGNIFAKDGKIYYAGFAGRGGATIYVFDLKTRKQDTVMAGVFGGSYSADGKKFLYRQGNGFGIADLKPGIKPGDGRLNLSNLEMLVDYRAEWKQVFYEAWRQARDFFYDANMHGVDWEAMKTRYDKLLPYLGHRDDLNYLIGELIGELNSSHTYRRGGEYPDVHQTSTGMLGCQFEADTQAGYYKISKIYKGENWNPQRFGPLSTAGVNVKEGEYLLAIDGVELKYPTNPYSLLINKAGKTITITVGAEPDLAKGRKVEVTTIGNDATHRYIDWMMTNLEKVDKATNGRVGYIYLPDTAQGGMEWFNRLFYAQLDKDALIVDARFNSGGFIPNFYLERLSRKLLNIWATRYSTGFRTPGTAHYGPKVCLTNAPAGSGGDAFPYYFRELGLGPIIGTRSWGGLIGISGNPVLMDNGTLSIADFSFINPEGEWDVENKGVTPDIIVENLPEDVRKGRDPQLEKAIEVIMQMLAEQTKKPVPDVPAKYPVR